MDRIHDARPDTVRMPLDMTDLSGLPGVSGLLGVSGLSGLLRKSQSQIQIQR